MKTRQKHRAGRRSPAHRAEESARRRFWQPNLELLEARAMLAFAVSAVNIEVIQHDAGNSSSSVSVVAHQATPGVGFSPNTSRGDYALKFGDIAEDDGAGGVLISSVRENGRVNDGDTLTGARYAVSATEIFDTGLWRISTTDSATTNGELNINTAAVYFPNAEGWQNGSVTTTAGNTVAGVPVTIPGVNPMNDGILLVTAHSRENRQALATPANSTAWNVWSHDVAVNGFNYSAGDVRWVYVPYTTPKTTAIVGRVMNNSVSGTGHPSILSGQIGHGASIVRTDVGQYRLSIAGQSPTSGVLLLSLEHSGNLGDNVISYQADGDSWIVEIRDMPASPPPLQDSDAQGAGLFSFLFVPTVLGGDNVPPVATGDSVIVPHNAPTQIHVLNNDHDPNGDPITIVAVGDPARGSVTLNPGGAITYTPNPGFSGLDSFTYTIEDGRGGTASATVQVAVNAPLLVIQQNIDGYAGAVDTHIMQSRPDDAFGSESRLLVDMTPGGPNQALVRFDNIFGSGPGQIPPGVTLTSATLEFDLTDPGNHVAAHRMLVDWNDSATWNSLGGGIQSDNTEALATADGFTGTSGLAAIGRANINVLSSVVAWQQNPSTNHGWAILPTGNDGLLITSSEADNVTGPPQLRITYIASADPASPTARNDTADTHVNMPVVIPVLANDSDLNGDVLAIDSFGQPANGTTSLSANQTITYLANSGFAGTDSFTYTISDGTGRTATATVSIAVSVDNGIRTFQQGTGGYLHSVDTFIRAADPNAFFGSDITLDVDSDDGGGPNHTLLQFDELFGTQPNQIPTGATIVSATLAMEVVGPGNHFGVYRMTSPWNATTTWNSVSPAGGVNSAVAIFPPDVTTGPVGGLLTTGTVSIDVTSSLQAWISNPLSNFGWGMISPTGTNGVDIASAEAFNIGLRPRLTVTIALPPPNTLHVSSLLPTDSGFVAGFSRPLTTSELNLYDQGGTLGAVDVMVVGGNVGNVRGSLVVNAAGDQVTFVKTGGVLANDSYIVTLRSASDAFHEGANLLDGNADGTAGDDYVATFIRNVAGGGVTASVPDFARGPGQVVDVWNAAGQAAYEGIPVLLSTGVGVRSASFTVSYDPALVEMGAVKLGAGVAAGTTLDYTIPSPGTINVTVSNASADLAASAGQLALVSLLRTDAGNPGQFLSPLVPAGATYGSSHAITITNLNAAGIGAIPINNVVADAGMHVVAYAGELSENGAYNSPDASFAQQFIVNQATFGLAAYPLTDPTILADINGNGSVQGNDVGQIQRLILGLSSPFVPPRPAPPPPAPMLASGEGEGDGLAQDSHALQALWASLSGGHSHDAVDALHADAEEEWYLMYFATDE